MLNRNNATHEALRITLTITLCMLAGKWLDFSSPVYFALYPTIAMTKGRDFSCLGLYRMFMPTLVSASLALVVSELFYQHPFIIWTISLVAFDQLRRRADTPQKLGAMLMPTFNWILIVVFSQQTTINIPERIWEIMAAMGMTIVIVRVMAALFPVTSGSKQPSLVVEPHPVSFRHRLVSLTLIGPGLAFLMTVDLLSATFCMVPVIAAATQFSRNQYLNVVKHRVVTQLGGCAIAVVFALLMAGHQNIASFYAIDLGLLIFALARLISRSTGPLRDTHCDALLATLLPIQLYMSNTGFGLSGTFLRAWELAVTLGILFALHTITQPWLTRDKKNLLTTGT